MNVKANPDDVKAGDFAYTMYDTTHPLHGDPDTISRWDSELKRFYGKRVRLTVNGFTKNPETGKVTRTFIQRVGQVEGYGGIFGPSSLFSRSIKVVRNRHSTDELVVNSLTIDLADDDDEDAES